MPVWQTDLSGLSSMCFSLGVVKSVDLWHHARYNTGCPCFWFDCYDWWSSQKTMRIGFKVVVKWLDKTADLYKIHCVFRLLWQLPGGTAISLCWDVKSDLRMSQNPPCCLLRSQFPMPTVLNSSFSCCIWHLRPLKVKMLDREGCQTAAGWSWSLERKHFNKLSKFCPQPIGLTVSISSDKAEELLPATPRESFCSPVRKPPLFVLARFILNGFKDGRIESFLQVLLREWRTLYVVSRPDLLSYAPRPGAQNGLDVRSVQVDEDVHVQQKVRLGTDEDNGRGRVMSPDLWNPLLGDVVKWGGVDQTEAQEKDVHVGIRQSPELIKLLLDGTRRQEVSFSRTQ